MIRGSGALWFVVKFVDGDNFWEEGDPAGWGVQRHDGRPTFDGTDDGVGRDRVAPQPSLWCDLSGPTGGLCVLDHPDNPSHPVPFYASCRAPGYGEGWSNTVYPAFLWDGPLRLAPAAELRFRYRVIVHDDLWDADQCGSAWESFVAGG